MAASRRARKIRQSSDFSLDSLRRMVRSPLVPAAAYSWELEGIMSARDAQIMGRFNAPCRLAVAMRTDDALAVAFKNRLAPQRALSVDIKAAPGPSGAQIAREAEALFGQEGIGLTTETLADINGDLANHGLAIGYNTWNVRDDGSRIDVEHHSWPLDWVWYHPTSRVLVTHLDCMPVIGVPPFELQPFAQSLPGSGIMGFSGGTLVPIIHGDGRWVIYRAHEHMPWKQDAAILSASLVWARHAFGMRDWAKGSASHGNAKVVGEMPEGSDMQKMSDDGTTMVLTPQAQEFLGLLQDVASLDCAVGIKPAGAKVDYLTNGSRAWEVWRELTANAEKAAARIYLGTDGTLGAQGGAPGVDIASLFGVATTIVQGDLGAITRGARSGIIEPWTALNFGDSRQAPTRCYAIVDPDEQELITEKRARTTAYVEALATLQGSGIQLTQEIADELADQYECKPITISSVGVSGKDRIMGPEGQQQQAPSATGTSGLRAV